MADFKIIIQDRDGTNQYELPASSFQFQEELNNDRTAQLSFDYAVVKPIADDNAVSLEDIFGGEYREIYIYMDDDLVYSGYLGEPRFFKGEDDRGSISIASRGFFSLLRKRITNSLRTYSSEDQGAIAQDLIDYTQGLDFGDFGIVAGSQPTSVNRDRTLRYRTIADVIVGMSTDETKNGFDFDVDNEKRFNIYPDGRGSRKRNIVFEEGFNILTFGITKRGIDSMANQVTVFGEGEGDDMLVEVRNAEDVYKDNFMLLQETLSHKDIIEAATLQDKGDRFLDLNKYPQRLIDVTCNIDAPAFTDYEVGDTVPVKIPSWNVDQELRIVKKGILNAPNNARAQVIFEPF